MTNPITPPPDLVQQWARSSSIPGTKTTEGQWQQRFARQAAQWGADQSGAAEIQKARDEELEECVKWLEQNCGRWELPAGLRAARRPPSLAEQATAELDEAVMRGDCITTTDAMPLLRAALNRLAELEALPQ